MRRADPVAQPPTSQVVPEIIFHGVDRSEWVERYVADRLLGWRSSPAASPAATSR